jgi:hypothetical protein
MEQLLNKNEAAKKFLLAASKANLNIEKIYWPPQVDFEPVSYENVPGKMAKYLDNLRTSQTYFKCILWIYEMTYLHSPLKKHFMHEYLSNVPATLKFFNMCLLDNLGDCGCLNI